LSEFNKQRKRKKYLHAQINHLGDPIGIIADLGTFERAIDQEKN
jgi:hypothetical protein